MARILRAWLHRQEDLYPPVANMATHSPWATRASAAAPEHPDPDSRKPSGRPNTSESRADCEQDAGVELSAAGYRCHSVRC